MKAPNLTMKFFPLIIFLFVICCYLTLAAEATSFPLTLTKRPFYKTSSSLFKNNLLSSEDDDGYNLHVKYTMVLIATIPIGNLSQPMNMVVDTGSEIGWLTCANRSNDQTKNPPMFVPIQSNTFSEFFCNESSDCVTDSSSVNCIQTYNVSRWHFSYYYEDQFTVEGDLFKDIVSLSDSQPQRIILGCTSTIEPSGAHGLMGMNLGKLSFPTQADITTFSYCVPLHNHNINTNDPPTGMLYLGSNPEDDSLRHFEYVDLLHFDIPSVDKNAYIVFLKNIYIGRYNLSAEDSMGPADMSGGCAMMIDSATQYSILLANTYEKLRNKVAYLTKGFKLTNSNATQQFDMCFLHETEPELLSPMIGSLTFEFDNNVTITVPEERILDYMDGKLCVTIGKPSMSSDTASTHILGIYHQQCHLVEYDIQRRKVGFGETESCKCG